MLVGQNGAMGRKLLIFVLIWGYSNAAGQYGYYIEMSVHSINETLSVFVSIYTIYPYEAGDENAVNSSVR